MCGHAQRVEIDERLRGKVNVAAFAREYGISRDQVYGHRANHVWHGQRESPDLGEAAARQETARNGKKRQEKARKNDPQTAFLTAYAATCDVKEGLKAAGITRGQFRKWQETDQVFVLRFNQAEIEAVESLEYEARIRAIAGSKLVRRVYRQGLLYEEVHEFRPSDAMMIKLLQAAKPEKYGERLTLTQTTVLKALDAQAWEAV